MVPLALVSDNAFVRGGLAEVLAGVNGVSVRHLVSAVTALPAADPPSLIVLDLYAQRGAHLGRGFWGRMPPHSRIIALCRPDDPPNLPVAVLSGVRGVLTRDTGAAELVVAVQSVRDGGLYVCAELLDALLRQMTQDPPEPQLTKREAETLQWVARGLTQSQISRRMGVTDATVATYAKRLRFKFHAANKAELVDRATELGYLPS